MKKTIVVMSIILVLVVEAVMLLGASNRDKIAPKLCIYQKNMEYSVGCSNDKILKGIEAYDSVDGDVSDSVEIVSRSETVEGRIEVVAVSACDKSGNVANTKLVFVVEDNSTFKILEYSNYKVNMENLEFSIEGAELTGYIKGYELTTEPVENITVEDVTAEETATQKNEETDTQNNVETKTEPVSVEDESTTEKNTKEAESESKVEEETTPTIVDGKPVIVLKEKEITVDAGASNVIYVNSIKEIYDDKDSRDTLFRRIGMTKNINLSVPGDYVQGLYCSDSDGNHSEVVQLTIHVK